jgi:hypothetical protein
VTQRKLFDYPSEVTKPNPEARVIRPPKVKGEEIIVYTPKHREVPEVAVVSQEEAERAREIKKREIEYHKMRMER